MNVIGKALVEGYFEQRAGHTGIKAARAQYAAWLALTEKAIWKTPQDIKAAHPRVSILKGNRIVFNIKGNDFRLVAVVQLEAAILRIRFFGTHEEYDAIDAETI